jgi:hypothetical protein
MARQLKRLAVATRKDFTTAKKTAAATQAKSSNTPYSSANIATVVAILATTTAKGNISWRYNKN